MKKLMLIVATVVLGLLSGCQTAQTGNPKVVLKHFFDSVSKKDFTEAQKYATEDSQGMLSMMEMGMQNSNSDHSDKMLEMIQNIQMAEPVVEGDRATILVKDKKSGETTDFLLKKENSNWKVAFNMATLMEMAKKKMKEDGTNGMGAMKGMMDSGFSQKEEKNDRAQKFMDSVMDSIRRMEIKKTK